LAVIFSFVVAAWNSPNTLGSFGDKNHDLPLLFLSKKEPAPPLADLNSDLHGPASNRCA
jgi:hypothetical protein